MNLLVLGSGGREHALVWKMSQSKHAEKIYCIPGNGGIADMAECHSLPLTDFAGLTDFVRKNEIDMTIVGPEQPLVEGIVDYFEAEGLAIFGPSKQGAQLEGSKTFAKEFMAKHNIPTAEFRAFDQSSDAHDYLNDLSERPVVVKADGLAAGKGVIVCPNIETANQAVDGLMTQKIFKQAGSRVVIEEMMTGEEVSIFVITDGNDYITLSPAQDFKRADENDKGKNTGGMGSYAPTPFLTDDLHKQVVDTIIEPMLGALREDGISYKGVLYVGLMLTEAGPKVVEFNCRFGDPETQVVLTLLQSDLVRIIKAVVDGNLGDIEVTISDEYAVAVVLASGGYPEYYEKGKAISGLNELPAQLTVFHAGTKKVDDIYMTNGGRVMAVVSTSRILIEATNRIYAAISRIHFDGMQYRRDIARRAWNALG
ncbi:MAG: phosphoribosylamine--glycine ligase [Calditrichia bacterium]